MQGVGFRPFVVGLAEQTGVTGWIMNDDAGVLLEAEGSGLGEFCQRLKAEAPPLAELRELVVEELACRGDAAFSIRESRDSADRFTIIPADAASCRECLGEILDPQDRRFRYPFTNCTHCGPRYSIVERLPYDRHHTSMKSFTMCSRCNAEYHDVHDRRFHAQPNACPVCGPTLVTEDGLAGDAALAMTVERLREGAVVAVKGLGGFHLACDAGNDAAVRRLRLRKRKSNKPFAVMVRDTEAVLKIARANPGELKLLESREAPIVLLERREDCPLSEAVSPGRHDVGIVLPYTPLHHLLFRTGQVPLEWLVMTSGNRAEEPIAATDEEAEMRLVGLADHRLTHDRDIVMRSDDSVLRVAGDRPRLIRRSRGWAPGALPFPATKHQILGCGAMLKGTFTLSRDGRAVMSQHIGDLESAAAMEFYAETLRHLSSLYRIRPGVIAHDLHPDYPSSHFAARYAEEHGIAAERVLAVQHHHAHIAAVMAEHGLLDPVIGVALDGTGYGPDGTIWGGEFLVVSVHGWERAGCLRTLQLPGGEAAIREPWRTAAGALVAALGMEEARGVTEALGWPDRFRRDRLESVLRIAAAPMTSVASSSAGRLFDAVSALLGICETNTFEGEAAMGLEAAAGKPGSPVEAYPFVVDTASGGFRTVDWYPCLRGIVEDLGRGRDRAGIAAAFHETIARAVVDVAVALADEQGVPRVALSGGVFQNALLLERVEGLLQNQGLRVFSHERVPTNDGGISLGQAFVAAGRCLP